MTNAVLIGRFRPFHFGHLALVTNAFKDLDLDSLTILVGSANRHQSVKNPFTFEQVKNMIGNALMVHDHSLPQEDRIYDKVEIKSLDDHRSDSAWQSQVRESAPNATHIIGFDKDESSYYLKMFPELKLYEGAPVQNLSTHDVLNASELRVELLSKEHDVSTLVTSFTRYLPLGTLEYLKHWITLPDYGLMRGEYESSIVEQEKFKWYPYPGCLNIACSDNVVMCNGMVLLVERAFAPGKGCLALPGGHKDSNETFLDCAVRELREETRLKVPEKVLRGSVVGEKMFDNPERSYPHTRITMAYYYEVQADHDGSMPNVRAADDAKSAKWYPLSFVKENASRMYDDHYQIIQHFTGI